MTSPYKHPPPSPRIGHYNLHHSQSSYNHLNVIKTIPPPPSLFSLRSSGCIMLTAHALYMIIQQDH